MRRAFRAIAVCALAAVVTYALFGWRSAGDAGRVPAAAAPVAAAQDAPAAVAPVFALAPEPQFSIPPLDSFRPMIERPLFSQTRRPNATVPQVAAAAPPPRSLDLTLHGIIYSDSDRLVVVSRPGQGAPERLGLGADYLGWTITDIGPRDVTFARDKTERRFELRFDAAGE